MKKSLLLVVCFLFRTFLLEGQVSYPLNSSFRYLKGSEAASLGSQWMDAGFDDSSWSTGSAPFRYGRKGATQSINNALIRVAPFCRRQKGAFVCGTGY